MATPTSSISVSSQAFLLLLLSPFLCLNFNAVEGTQTRFHTLKIESLQQSDVCDESPDKVVSKGSSSLKVIHKYGPCNPNKASTAPSFTELLRRDQLRVESIAWARKSMNSAPGVLEQKSKLGVPKLGVPFRCLDNYASNYFVNVGLGTPRKEFPLIFDTGSGLIWTQCKPCKPCFENVPLFDPTKSASYTDVACSSQTCKLLQESCSASKCGYQSSYLDNTTASGTYAVEYLTIGSSVKHTVLIGCSTQVVGDSSGESGIIGLDLSPLSFPSQTAKKYNNIFSYCLPSNPASTGHLTFGGNLPNDLKFAQILNKDTDFYDIPLAGITIGGRKPLTNAKFFKAVNVTVDSGTVLTRLSSKAYSALRSEFRGLMKDYNPVFEIDILDTCYNFSRFSSVNIPAITLFFKDGIELDIDVSGIMIPVSDLPKVYCLGFAELGDNDQEAILGNVQQKTYTVFFYGGKRRVGFVQGGCN